ncbi:MAG: stimulus-sensing domain-containing protein [Sphingomonadales bacterium]
MTSIPPRKVSRRPRPFSPLTLRILALNIVALAFLVGGVLYLDQFRTGLIDTRLSGLRVQAEVIAAAIGEAATLGPEATTIEQGNARQILARLVVPTRVRARIFDADGVLVIDSRALFSGRKIMEATLPSPSLWTDFVSRLGLIYEGLIRFLARDAPLPGYVEQPEQRAQDYHEAVIALGGSTATAVRSMENGSLMLSAAVPIQRFKRVLGTLLATVETSEIEEMVRQERLAILEIFAVALIVTALLSLILARTIARPVHRLADAADKVRRRHGRDVEIPDFSGRRDEIGDLSRSLRDMTEALYGRMDAIEAFAADVAHEIKNPLTSLRSAVETFARSRDKQHQAQLLSIIKDDVGRIDRLISDISNASRIDAELSRADMEAVDVAMLLKTLVGAYPATSRRHAPSIELDIPDGEALVVQGIESKLGQVIRNLLDNAVSFSPITGDGAPARINVTAKRDGGKVVIAIDDEGPGIPDAMLRDIFNRFYTERPDGEAFGAHSGLGLSISKQIVEAHGGSIEAQNRYHEGTDGSFPATGPVTGKGGGAARTKTGARFIVRLPA